MSLWTIVLLASAATLASKLLGYAVPPRWLEAPRANRIADLLTVALLAALFAVQAFAAGTAIVIDARLVAVAVAAGLLLLRAPFVLVVFAAAAVAALLRAFVPGAL